MIQDASLNFIPVVDERPLHVSGFKEDHINFISVINFLLFASSYLIKKKISNQEVFTGSDRKSI